MEKNFDIDDIEKLNEKMERRLQELRDRNGVNNEENEKEKELKKEKKRQRMLLAYAAALFLGIVSGFVFWSHEMPDGRTRLQQVLDRYYGRTPVLEMRM